MKFDINNILGVHKLTGVSYSSSEEGYVFEIDGKLYLIYEDYPDEYRSECAIMQVETDEFEKITRFPPQEVNICIGDYYDGEYMSGICFESLDILNKEDNSLILRGWTEDWQDYYPSAQFSYYPENLSINK